MKQINKTKAKSLLLALTVGAMTLAQLTACSTADEVTDNTMGEAVILKLNINGILPTDNSESRSGSLVDNTDHTGGMNFKWTESTDKITAVAHTKDGSVAEWGVSAHLSTTVSVTPDNDNTKKATLNANDDIWEYYTDNEEDGKLFCVQNLQDKKEDDTPNAQNVTGTLPMPKDNIFTQTEKNQSSHLTDYLYMMGSGDIKDEIVSNDKVKVAEVDVTFKPAVATIRLQVTNKRTDAVSIKNIDIKSSENVFPNLKDWKFYLDNGVGKSCTVTEPKDKASYYSTITAQCGTGTDGFEVASGEALYNYVAVHQHDAENVLAGKSLDFVITTADGTYTAYNFDCDKLAEITKNADFVAGYTYTFKLSLKDKLTLSGVTVSAPTGSSTDLPGWSTDDETDIE